MSKTNVNPKAETPKPETPASASANAPSPDPAGVEVPTLEEQLAAALAERDQFKDKWTRALADHENYRRRMLRELEEDRKYSAGNVIKALLPAFDGLDRAIFAASQSKNADELIGGVQMTIKQLETALNGLGAKTIAAVGQPFDPNLHEAISQVPSADHPPMTILHDVERGYMMHDRVLRPTKVVVSQASG